VRRAGAVGRASTNGSAQPIATTILGVYLNLIQDCTMDGIKQLWAADITYIHILVVCFVYLAVILDVYFRKAIGYAISRNLDTELTLGALRMVIDQRNPPLGCIHHSDRGVQYASKEYIKELEFYKFQISMSRKGNPFDNAYVESFMKILKSEEVHLWDIAPCKMCKNEFLNFIEDVYNHKWLHSAIGYCPPNEYEFMLESTPKPSQDTLIRLL
jgi:transposase InsO family protein